MNIKPIWYEDFEGKEVKLREAQRRINTEILLTECNAIVFFFSALLKCEIQI